MRDALVYYSSTSQTPQTPFIDMPHQHNKPFSHSLYHSHSVFLIVRTKHSNQELISALSPSTLQFDLLVVGERIWAADDIFVSSNCDRIIMHGALKHRIFIGSMCFRVSE